MSLTAHPRACVLAALLSGLWGTGVALADPDHPETVVITYQVRAGAQTALERVIAEHWRVAQRMQLVLSVPHIVLEGTDTGGRYIVEVLAWRDGSIPDNAPAAITKLWGQMEDLVETRDGHPGINFARVSVLMHQPLAWPVHAHSWRSSPELHRLSLQDVQAAGMVSQLTLELLPARPEP